MNVANDAALVAEVLAFSKLASDANVTVDGQTLDLLSVLTHKRELSTVTQPSVKSVCRSHAKNTTLAAEADKKDALKDYLWAADWADVLRDYPAVIAAQYWLIAVAPLQTYASVFHCV